MSLENAIFRILNADGSTAGTGFLVAPTHAVSSTRWVSSSQQIFRLKFNGLDEIFEAENVSDQFHPALALLRLKKAPKNITPLKLGRVTHQQIGTEFLMFSYPRDKNETGSYTTCVLKNIQTMRSNEEWLLLQTKAPAPDDLSGSPVLDETNGRVIGIVHSVDGLIVRAMLSNQIPQPEHHTSAKPPIIDPQRDDVQALPGDDFEDTLTKDIEATETNTNDASAGEEPEETAKSPIRQTPPTKRVLNVNFAAVDDPHALQVYEPLHANETYHLLVDVGLPWDKIPSLLSENAAFPEDSEVSYLRAEDRQKGWFDLEVVFVSQQFTPNLVSGRMRIQADSLEQSKPYIHGKLSERSGPLHLTVQTPKNHTRRAIRARGRLCLYYGAQVLQSAVIDVGINPTHLGAEPELAAKNRALIDYVLTPGFKDVGQTISQRQRSGRDGKNVTADVKVGLMLNDDLSGTHRILLKVANETDETASLPPAWKAYDSSAIGKVLEDARHILANPTGTEPNYESDTFIFDKFKDDLLALAKLGAGLYNMLLQGLTPADGVNPLLWRKKFRNALQPGDVIQLARAGSVPSTHIIPWALVYDGPLELDRSDLPLTLCRVVDEQWNSNTAKRKPPFNTQENFVCPYEHEHAENTVCPFGFWGYKYTLEQPISALLGKNWDVAPARRILAGTPVKMAVAATEDVPRENRRLQHFQRIHDSINAEYLPAAPASERDQVRDSLHAPQLVYILCHGGKDGKNTYLSIGPRGKDARYTITPELPGTWGERDFIDVEKWTTTRPLVFINGCYTTDLLPELTLNFVSAFRDLLAGGVIGTEIPVTVEHGYLAAEKFFERLGRGEDVGQAILGMRWDLLNQGSFLGLAYTPYAMADLHLER